MNKKILIIISIIMSTIMILCGCTDQKALTAGEESGQLKLKSNSVVELHRSSFNINTKLAYDRYTDETYEIIENIEVNYLFKNIAGRQIHIKVSAEFYDKNDRLVGIEESGFINLPEDYTEKAYTPQNSIIYSGSNVADVQYALLIVEEIV
jgi:hypothetical protein